MNRLRRLETILKSTPVGDQQASPELAADDQKMPRADQSARRELNTNNKEPKEPNHEAQLDDLDEFDRWNPMSEDFTSSKNTLTLRPDCEPLTSLTGKLQPISSKIGNVTICERFATYGECADGRFCNRLHVDPEAREKIWAIQSTYESNKGRTCMNFTYLSPLDVEPDPNSLLLVSIASVTSPSNFYVVAPFGDLNFANLDQPDIEFYTGKIQQTSTVKRKLEQFHQQMADMFEHPYRVDNLNDDIYLSQIVGCKLKDGYFRRAMVIDLPDPADYADLNYRLFLMDVGVEVELPREMIYDIKANILSEPPLALNCRLDIKPSKGDLSWSAGALAQFRNLVKQNRFSLCIVTEHIKADRILTVDLLDLHSRVSYTGKMLATGLASKCAC